MMPGAAYAGRDAIWAAYLLVSPTRSSIAGAAPRDAIGRLVAWHNGEEDALAALPACCNLSSATTSPPETAVLRPWRLAETLDVRNAEHARHAMAQVARASGFRARLAALRDSRLSAASGENNEEDGLASAGTAGHTARMDMMDWHLDGLTYVAVDFCNSRDVRRKATVRALVDTGSTECDLKQEIIESVGLSKLPGAGSMFETAAGRTLATSLYDVALVVSGVEVHARVSPADETGDDSEADDTDEDDIDKAFGFGANTDDAVLGSAALASVGLVVDCRSRQLLPPPEQHVLALPFTGPGPHVFIEISHPTDPARRAIVRALVDTGSTDVDLSQSIIDRLDLEIDTREAPAQFETAGGITVEAPIYSAVIKALGREAVVRVSPTEAPEVGGDESNEEEGGACSSAAATAAIAAATGAAPGDEALLGHDALAALGLLVDCRNRQLLLVQ